MTDTLLEIKNLSHSYSGNKVLNKLSLEVQKGELLCILGPSGCGKSTLLQSIAGFNKPDEGQIIVQAQTLFDGKINIDPEKRKIGLVFQDYSLFPHLNVEKNISYGISKLSTSDKKTKVEYLLKVMGLSGYEKKYPHQLSGGEQQRVAIARALAPEPSFLLLDEPFSNLDPSLRDSLGEELKDIFRSNGVTAIFITHDQQEAFLLGDRVAILNQGYIHQVDTPSNLCHSPQTKFVADFLKSGKFIEGVYENNSVVTSLGKFSIQEDSIKTNQVQLYLPSQSLTLTENQNKGLPAQIKKRTFCGGFFSYDIFIEKSQQTISSIESREKWDEEANIFLEIDQSLIKKAFES